MSSNPTNTSSLFNTNPLDILGRSVEPIVSTEPIETVEPPIEPSLITTDSLVEEAEDSIELVEYIVEAVEAVEPIPSTLTTLTAPSKATYQLRFKLDRDTLVLVTQATLVGTIGDPELRRLDLVTSQGKFYPAVLPSPTGRDVGRWLLLKDGIPTTAVEFEENWLDVVMAIEDITPQF